MRDAIALANLVVTGYLTGLIWCVQVVHYPLFARVGEGDFPRYHRLHVTRITYIVAAPMVIEMGLSVALLALRPAAFPGWAAWVCLLLTAGAWLSTFGLSVPLHGALTDKGYDARSLARLVATNWPRTAAWSVRFVILTAGTFALMK